MDVEKRVVMTAKSTRAKLSRTVAPETYRSLAGLVQSGRTGSLAEAVECFRRNENRRQLARATAEYFEGLSPEAMAEENTLGKSLGDAAKGIDFDREP
jgi:hypothetical protein